MDERDEVIEMVRDYVVPETVEKVVNPPRSSVVMTGEGEMSDLGRYVTADDAFRVYQAQQHRSLRKTANMLGLPHGTLLSWSARYGWQQRLRDQDREVTEGVVQSVAIAVLQAQIKNIQTLVEIRDAPDSHPLAKLQAIKLLTGQYNRLEDQALVQALMGTNEIELEEANLVELAQTPDGARQLVAKLRERVGQV